VGTCTETALGSCRHPTSGELHVAGLESLIVTTSRLALAFVAVIFTYGGHSETLIRVFWTTSLLLWETIVVGAKSSFSQMFPYAVSSAWGRRQVVSNVLIARPGPFRISSR